MARQVLGRLLLGIFTLHDDDNNNTQVESVANIVS